MDTKKSSLSLKRALTMVADQASAGLKPDKSQCEAILVQAENENAPPKPKKNQKRPVIDKPAKVE